MSTAFQHELSRWGPDHAGDAPPSRAAAEEYCRRLTAAHYENFPVVSFLLPARLRQHFCNVYAYCRWADDLGDEVGDAKRSLELLAWWKEQLADCYAGSARHPVFVALRQTIDTFRIPPAPFEDLVSAFEQDQRVCEYETFEQLRDYCRRSADPVGRLVLYLCGQFNEQNAAWSDSICTGLQLANFWQDVSRDFDLGRVYIPREDRLRFGYTEEYLAARVTNDAFVQLMTFEVDRARRFLIEGLPLVECLPGRLQVDIDLFARGGLKILDRIEAIGYRVWQTRPVVGTRDRVGLLLRAAGRATLRRLGVGRARSNGSMPLSAETPNASASNGKVWSLDESYTWCETIAKRRAGNFYYSFLTLPRGQFRAMCVLYAYMRVCDDFGDDASVPAEQRRTQLADWRDSVARALDAGRYEHPALPALAEIVREYGIPREQLFEVISGVEADLLPREIGDWSELSDYCYQVAGAVGICCIHIWGYRDPQARECAVDCGTAFQLTNILRDVGEDAAMNRVYLPREDLDRFGYTRDDIAAHCRDGRFRGLMQFEVARAREYYRRAERLFDYLESPGRAIFAAMLRIYGGLLTEIERRDYDVYSTRICLPRWRKLLAAAGSVLRPRAGLTGGRNAKPPAKSS